MISFYKYTALFNKQNKEFLHRVFRFADNCIIDDNVNYLAASRSQHMSTMDKQLNILLWIILQRKL